MIANIETDDIHKLRPKVRLAERCIADIFGNGNYLEYQVVEISSRRFAIEWQKGPHVMEARIKLTKDTNDRRRFWRGKDGVLHYRSLNQGEIKSL